MTWRFAGAMLLGVLAGCSTGERSLQSSDSVHPNWVVGSRSENSHFEHDYCLAETSMTPEARFGVLRWLIGFDGKSFGLDRDRIDAFGINIVPVEGASTWSEGDFALLKMTFSSGEEIELTIGVFSKGLIGTIDTSEVLRDQLTAVEQKTATVEIISETRSYSGKVNLEGLQSALQWIDACAVSHGAG